MTSAPDGGEWSASLPGRALALGKEAYYDMIFVVKKSYQPPLLREESRM
jgi:hypothetical protein